MSDEERDHLAPEPPRAGRRAVLGAALAGGLGLAFAGSLEPLWSGGRHGSAPRPVAFAEPVGGHNPGLTGAPITADTPALGSAAEGYGALVLDPAARLSLPAGFDYTVIAEAGRTRLVHGGETPGYQDGSASFPASGGRTVVINNHEQSPPPMEVPHPVPALRGLTYDPACPGGVTTIVLDPDGHREREYVSLAGTDHNCAGGVTPWGTWLSCEETEARKGEHGRTQDHGYVFEVDPTRPDANQDPAPIKCLGRFLHEAVAIDPQRGHLYLTEDAEWPNGLLYRWTPPLGRRHLGRGVLRRMGATAGTLEAMRAHDALGLPVSDLSVATEPGTTYRLQWVAVPDRDAQQVSTRKQFAYLTTDDHGKLLTGAGPAITRSRKLEGAWWGNGGAYIVSSFAKPEEDHSPQAHSGQVWFLDPAAQTLELVLRFAPDGNKDTAVDGPDNITVSPYGGLIIAEDGDGANHLLGATPMGATFAIARTEATFQGGAPEFTGPNFSPDRRTLFANVQEPGTVFAIRGPWRTRA
ncbi:MAG TPA: alkaline phosphatase PhoX [Sporichthyaceae bacterium]